MYLIFKLVSGQRGGADKKRLSVDPCIRYSIKCGDSNLGRKELKIFIGFINKNIKLKVMKCSINMKSWNSIIYCMHNALAGSAF